MIEGWQDRIDEAQHETTADVGGAEYARIAQGAGAGDLPGEPCGDCGAQPGQLHVSGCTTERCPRCAVSQRFGCYCFTVNPMFLRLL